MWPGFEISTKWFTDGIFLNVDTVTKFTNTQNILQSITEMQEEYSNQQIVDYFKRDDSGNGYVVITTHNTKQYLVDGLTFSKTPKNTFIAWKNKDKQIETNLVDYFNLRYEIKLKDSNQPMLFVKQKDQTIYLPAEICYEANLPEDFTKDFSKVKKLQKYKITNPNDRVNRINTLMNTFEENEEF